MLDGLSNVLRFAGVLLAIVGVWFLASGVRTVVSGRIDERRTAAASLRRGLPVLAVGVLLIVISFLLPH